MASKGYSLVAVKGLLIAVASAIAGHGLQVRGLQELQLMGSEVVAQGLNCPVSCEILVPGPGIEPVSSVWQEYS